MMSKTKSHITSEEAILKYFQKFNDEKLFRRGKDAVDAEHIITVNYDGKLEVLFGEVWASMKDRKYSVRIFLSKEEILHTFCTCPVGKSERCHHAAALALHAVANLSCTDVECRWVAPGKPGASNKGLPIEDLVLEGKSFKATDSNIDIPYQRFLNTLSKDQRGAIHLRWLVSDCDGDEDVEESADEGNTEEAHLRAMLPHIESIVTSLGYKEAGCPITYLKGKAQVSWDFIVHVASCTVGQYKNRFWFDVREHRGSASKFSAILRNVKSNQSFAYLAQEIAQRTVKKSGEALQWGLDHESDAIVAFETWSKQTVKVKATGAWLHESGLLVASPDGLVGDHAIIEIKCPFSLRLGSLREGIMLMKDPYIVFFDHEKQDWVVNKKHDYYHQIQGQLYLTKRKVAYLCVWHPVDNMLVRRIELDSDWEHNLDLLVNWMCKKYIPYIFKCCSS